MPCRTAQQTAKGRILVDIIAYNVNECPEYAGKLLQASEKPYIGVAKTPTLAVKNRETFQKVFFSIPEHAEKSDTSSPLHLRPLFY